MPPKTTTQPAPAAPDTLDFTSEGTSGDAASNPAKPLSQSSAPTSAEPSGCSGTLPPAAAPARQRTIADFEPLPLNVFLFAPEIKNAFVRIMSSEDSANRILSIAAIAARKNPLIAKCSRESLFQVLQDLAALDLMPDGREAHVIPFYNFKTKRYDASLVIDYKGYKTLARRNPAVKDIYTAHVHENDKFRLKNGRIDHEIDITKDRGKALGCCAQITFTNGGVESKYMSIEEIEVYEARSKAKLKRKEDGSLPTTTWDTHRKPMFEKTPLLYVLRRAGVLRTITRALDIEDAKDDDSNEPATPAAPKTSLGLKGIDTLAIENNADPAPAEEQPATPSNE